MWCTLGCAEGVRAGLVQHAPDWLLPALLEKERLQQTTKGTSFAESQASAQDVSRCSTVAQEVAADLLTWLRRPQVGSVGSLEELVRQRQELAAQDGDGRLSETEIRVAAIVKLSREEVAAKSLQAELDKRLAAAEIEVENMRTFQAQAAAEAEAKAAPEGGGGELDQELVRVANSFETASEAAAKSVAGSINLLDGNMLRIRGPTEELKASANALSGRARGLKTSLEGLLQKVRAAKASSAQRVQREARKLAAEEAKKQEGILHQYDKVVRGVSEESEVAHNLFGGETTSYASVTELGVPDPCYWDPLGLNQPTFQRRRAVEIKHGHIAVRATNKFVDLRNGLAALSMVPVLGGAQIITSCGLIETTGFFQVAASPSAATAAEDCVGDGPSAATAISMAEEEAEKDVLVAEAATRRPEFAAMPWGINAIKIPETQAKARAMVESQAEQFFDCIPVFYIGD